MGYGGGPGAFVTFAKGYGIDLEELAKTVPSDGAAVCDGRGCECLRVGALRQAPPVRTHARRVACL